MSDKGKTPMGDLPRKILDTVQDTAAKAVSTITRLADAAQSGPRDALEAGQEAMPSARPRRRHSKAGKPRAASRRKPVRKKSQSR